jgi:tRNA uridine 5-carboxymethylaminomethyl modification enzyme
LTEKGYQVGLIPEERYEKLRDKKEKIEFLRQKLQAVQVSPNSEVNAILAQYNQEGLRSPVTGWSLLARPGIDYELLKRIVPALPDCTGEVREQIEIEALYSGYIKKQTDQIERFNRLEAKLIPTDFPYERVKGLSGEAKEKLLAIKPQSIGQASRISGVSPADISILLVAMERSNQGNNQGRTYNET